MDSSRVQSGKYNRIIGVHGPRECGKTTLATQLLLDSPGYRVCFAARRPPGEYEWTKVKSVGDLPRSVFWRPNAVHVVTATGDCFAELLTVCRQIVQNTRDWKYLLRGQGDDAPVIPCTIMLDEAVRWSGIAAGRRTSPEGRLALEYFANARWWGVGLIHCAQSPRMIDEIFYSLSTEIYSFHCKGLDARRIALSDAYSEEEVNELSTLAEHEYRHKIVGKIPQKVVDTLDETLAE